MKKFIIKFLYFLLPVFILAYPLDYSISHYLKSSNKFPGEHEVWNDIYKSKAVCDLAIYGSSRAWVQIDPKILSDSLKLKAYNFGIDGHNFILQYLRHLELLKFNNKPKTIILSVDIFTLQKRKDLYEFEQFLPIMLWNKNIEKFTSQFTGFKKLDYYIPLIRYAGQKSALNESFEIFTNQKRKEKYRVKGYRGMDKKWNNDFDKAKEKNKAYKIKVESYSLKLLEQFIEECKKNNIELILIYPPEYIEGQKFVINRSEAINLFKQLSSKYVIPFYDYSKNKISFARNNFYNASHLNKLGSEQFTNILAKDLKARSKR